MEEGRGKEEWKGGNVFWQQMSNTERLDFCNRHYPGTLHTCNEWETLSPTAQLVLRLVGIQDRPNYLAQDDEYLLTLF